MPKKKNKEQAKKQIADFFKNLQGKTPREIKKIKRLAMHHNIKLGNLRKKFCKKCYSTELKVKRIKNKKKTLECKNCGQISRWKMRD